MFRDGHPFHYEVLVIWKYCSYTSFSNVYYHTPCGSVGIWYTQAWGNWCCSEKMGGIPRRGLSVAFSIASCMISYVCGSQTLVENRLESPKLSFELQWNFIMAVTLKQMSLQERRKKQRFKCIKRYFFSFFFHFSFFNSRVFTYKQTLEEYSEKNLFAWKL